MKILLLDLCQVIKCLTLFKQQINFLGGIGQLNKARKPNYLIVDKNTTVTDIEEAFKDFCTRGDIAIILINQHVAEMIRYAVDQHTTSIPAVLEIPSKEMPYDPSKVSSLFLILLCWLKRKNYTLFFFLIKI